MSQVNSEADMAVAAPGGDDAKLSKGALSWSLYEGVRDPYVILITIYIFMPYVASSMVGDSVRGQAIISQWSQYSGWITMATAPFLGASVDRLGRRKGWLAFCTILMAPLMVALWWAKPDGSGLSVTAVMIITTIIGLLFSYTEVLHNSLLVRAAGMEGAHKASSLALALANIFALVALGFTAWAFALPGLGLPLVPEHPLFGLNPAAGETSRITGPMAGLLLALGALPLFLFTPDAPRSTMKVVDAFKAGAADLWSMLKTVRQRRDAFIFLISRMFYVDGMTAVLLYAGVYATGVMKWGPLEMLLYGIILTVLAVIGGFAARWFDAGLGPKRAVQLEILMSFLGIIAIIGMAPDKILFFWHYDVAAHAPMWGGPVFKTLPEWIFILIGFSNAVFITAHYASSRTLLTRLTPPEQTGAFFGAYAVSGTATVWLGSFLVNLGTNLTHTQQGGFATISILLFVGFIGLLFVREGGLAPAGKAGS
ncbi:MAG: MFS transporter [Caulobacteraceae bacterium]